MAYRILLALHSWNRWLVLLFGVMAAVTAFAAVGHPARNAKANRWSVFFVSAVDAQLLLGLTLYLFFTPWIHLLGGGGSHDRVIRFWGIEHAFGMFVALVLIHVGRVSVKRTTHSDTPAGSMRRGAVLFLIAMLIMLASIPWPSLPYGRPLLRL